MDEETPANKRFKLDQQLRDINDNFEIYELTLDRTNAMLYIRYTSLQDKGFTKEQAFEIVKHRGLL